ncbi:MAG: class beta-lactamase-related serine hydrolase [Segetibacter sp.]|nr:class beta-lactamase-related serine hydrolase [Segetibacter sp.]
MNRSLLLLLVVMLMAGQIPAQEITQAAKPEAAGFSAERLKRIDVNLDDWVSKGWMNGAVGLIVRDGKIAYYKSAGYNDLNTKAAMQKDGIFRIASQTKAITSVAVMMLYEEGKFLLDDAVSKYIPAFANERVLDKFNGEDSTYTTVPAKRQITIRDLLTHTSGLGYAQIGTKEANAIYAKNNITAGLDVYNDNLADAMKRLGGLPLIHQPGEQWMYGLNVDLLGYLVEIWSGMSLDSFFRERIFEPIGMNDTYFNVPAEKANRLVYLYTEDSVGHLIKQTGTGALGLNVNFPLRKKTYFSGGGGLSSTVYDYAVFLQMLLNGGEYNGKRLLSRNTVRMMTMNQIGNIDFGDNKFGFGFAIVTEKGSAAFPSQAGTFSWRGAFSTSYWADPKEKMIVIFYRQSWITSHGDLGDRFRVLSYQALND